MICQKNDNSVCFLKLGGIHISWEFMNTSFRVFCVSGRMVAGRLLRPMLGVGEKSYVGVREEEEGSMLFL